LQGPTRNPILNIPSLPGQLAMVGTYSPASKILSNTSYERYGAAPGKLPASYSVNRSMNFAAILISLLVPCLIFVIVDGVVSFTIHSRQGTLCYGVCALTLIFVLGLGVISYNRMKRERSSASLVESSPNWVTFLFVTSMLAWGCGLAAGSNNYLNSMRPFFDVSALNIYQPVDPTEWTGSSVMDAGRVIFVNGARVDTTRTMSFRNHETYCVAPIIVPNRTMTRYDFWAVGLNCCNGASDSFQCNDVADPRARTGLRLMRDLERPFYRLAVKQAEVAYDIDAIHPIFFQWQLDPMRTINSYQKQGFTNFVNGAVIYLVVQLMLVLIATFAFAKLSKEQEAMPISIVDDSDVL